MNKDLMFSNKNNNWETPKKLFKELDNVFEFEVDVCSKDETAKCSNYYTPEVDGLSQEWKKTCWMNPPYGREQKEWITKASKDSDMHSSTIVCLIPARPDTKIWHDIIFKYAKAICFIKGRLKFGNSKDAAPFPSALVVFSGDVTEEQKNILNRLGFVIYK